MTITRNKSRFIYAGLIILGILSFVFAEGELENLSFEQHFLFDARKAIIIFSLFLTFVGIAGLIIQNRNYQNNLLKSYYSLVKKRQGSSKEVERKINRIFHQIDKVRMYKRHAWGLGDFMPLIRVRRYVRPSVDLIEYMDSLESSLFAYIAQYEDEKAVDECLAKATEVTQKIIENLNSAK